MPCHSLARRSLARRSFAKRWWYNFLHVGCRLAAVVLFRIRCQGREHLPRTGGVIVLSNHQSHLDPVLIGLACDRRMNFLARSTLFGFVPFRWLIRSLDAIAIDREGLGISGIKETLRRLKRGEVVLIFPEGTRTSDGQIAPLKPGFAAIAKRANVPLIPVSIDGAFDAWPRTNTLPRRSTIRIQFAPAISPEMVAAMSQRELVNRVQHQLEASLRQARASRQRAERVT